MAVPAEVEGPGDAELIAAVRSGDTDAYSLLYRRHVNAAYNLARQLARSGAEADDLVSESFAKVLDTLRAGRGPDSAFRAYLLTALRHTAYDKTKADRRVQLSDDITAVSETKGVSPEAVSVPFTDTAVAGLERSLAARAFAKLPERWQAVLWHTEIEGQSPAEVAPILGLTANGVSALAYRAREGLRQAYLQVHLAETAGERCRATVDRLGAWTRSGLSKRETAQVEAHLDQCDQCRALAAELMDVNGALRGILAPVVLGTAATAYLAAAGASAKAGATAAAAGAAGAAGGAASAAPRQFVGMAGSATAMAAAVAIGLASNSTPPQIPNALQQPPAPQAPASPGSPPAAPPGSAPAPPGSPPAAPPAAPGSPPAAPPQNPPPGSPPNPPAPAPGQPKLTTAADVNQVELIPGGAPQDLRLTVRNTGKSKSKPVTATLNLPPGVRALSSGSTNGFSTSPSSASTFAAPGEVRCPGGTGQVRCSSGVGLAPGDSVVLVFRLQADEDTKGGTITGSVNAGTTVRTSIAVPVKVRPAPDQLTLEAYQVSYSRYKPAIQIIATNRGGSTKPIELTLDTPAFQANADEATVCRHTYSSTHCRTAVTVPPGESVELTLIPFAYKPKRDVTVHAQLGTASASRTVHLEYAGHHPPKGRGPIGYGDR